MAYALTVHKAQGSDFEIVFLIVPREAQTLSRELIYTGLTRFRKRLVLLVQGDTSTLRELRLPGRSATHLRNTNLFALSLLAHGSARKEIERNSFRLIKDASCNACIVTWRIRIRHTHAGNKPAA